MLPNFELAKAEIGNSIVDGAFKAYLLKYLENVEGRFLVGELNKAKAQKALLTLP